MRSARSFLIPALALAALTACESEKSSNPLSPSVAGPIAGVTITAPKLLEPAQGAQVDNATQPLTLVVENATTNGVRPLSYVFEIATDAGFTSKVYTREGVAPGANNRTSLRLPDPLAADKTYYWRARAQDGANTGPYASGVNFSVVAPIRLDAPTLISPAANAILATNRVTFVVGNAIRSGPVGTMRYTLQVARDGAFSQMVTQLDVAEGAYQTQLPLAMDLAYSTVHFWRACAYETSKSTVGPWSVTLAFQTGAAPPTPSPGPPPAPSPTPTPPSGGYPNNGPDVINYVKAHWPSYLAAGVSSSRRRSNMEFLRDRIIETGICGGMDLGWNLKRGGPELSVDYITYRKAGQWIGVDVAQDYDNTSLPLRLHWSEVDDDPYTTPKAYTPRPTCQ